MFIFEHFEKIVGPPHDGRYVDKWKTRWSAIKGVRGYVDKMTEELVDPALLLSASDSFLRRIATVYQAYRDTLLSNNRLDFVHQQRLVYDLLLDAEIASVIVRGLKYVMVDEYQDTNFIQEQLLLKLTADTHKKQIDRHLQPYYHRLPFEPESRITLFDRLRLHYVAFSRPEKILVLTSHTQPKAHFAPIWQGLPQWPYVQKDLLAAQRFQLKDRIPIKRTFSFTGDLKVYETCPRQYQFFRDYDFTPSRSATIFFGLLVHQSIEEIHRVVLDGKLATLNETRIRHLFERTFSFLTLADVRPIGDTAKEAAFSQVMNYFRQNQGEMQRVIETEVDVSVEKDGYILAGKADLLMGDDGRLELLDFKTSPKPVDFPALLTTYERQLCTYAHILEQRYGKRPDRLLLYWTAESCKADALMEFPYRPERVTEAGVYFDQVVSKILQKDFTIQTVPENTICKEYDLRRLCHAEGTIQLLEEDGR